jgi:chromosome segregation ATPase|mmetsp:Transcript_65044/g.102442  ORF Transcript_65044/g.102442 Transcript_65044/m.102442 type:complete len:696 (-) Transcript_65044:41-2128(-)
MRQPSLVFIAVGSLAFGVQAATLKDRTSSAISLLLRSEGPSKVDTNTLVASLGEVAKGLQKEDDKAFQLLQASKADCKKKDVDMKLSMDKDQRASDMATADYQKTAAQLEALKASKSEVQDQVTASNTELNNLQAKLKQMRKDQGVLKTSSSKSLRQIEAVIAKSYLRDKGVQRKGPTALQKKVMTLEELSKSLSFLQTDDGIEDGNEAKREVDAQKTEDEHTPTLILKADKQEVVKASQAVQRGFDEEEKKILDLIEVERKKLQDLEDNLQDLQPAISNKLKQAMEINRTLDAAKRGLERDSSLLKVVNEKCSLIEEKIADQRKKRGSVVNDVAMASQLIEHMDTALFLARDLRGLNRPVQSFLQLDSSSRDETPEAITQPVSFVQEADASSVGLEQMIENYGSSMGMSAGPFDKVQEMISGLIASLKNQANEEVNQNQFCQDSLSKNRNDRLAKKNAIDTLSSTMRWSEMAIVRLDDDVKYLEDEIKRLADEEDAEEKALTKETTRVDKELKEHKVAGEVVAKSVEILTQLCDLDSSLIQRSSEFGEVGNQRSSGQSSSSGSRLSQCQEAANLLKDAASGLQALDKATNEYLEKYTDMSKSIKDDAKSSGDARDSELKSTKAARAQRASELATANKDIKEAQKELKLIDDAKAELEHQCSHVETREEKMARRKDEIDALKEALNVLQGESIPV